MVTSQIRADARRELEDTDDAGVLGEVERARKAKLDRDYPKPDAASIKSWDSYLDGRFRAYWTGRATVDSTETAGGDSLQSIRDMRYGRDQLPQKLRERKAYAERIRTGLSHNEIDRVVALMGRNPLKVDIPASSSNRDARERAQRQTRFCTKLPLILDKQSPFPLMQRIDDAMTEAGMVGVEFYLTGAYDDIDEDGYEPDDEGPSERERERYLTSERRKRRLPFGIRYVDPATVKWELEGDEFGVVIIKEKKRWRHVRRVINQLTDEGRRYSDKDEDGDERIPDPGDRGDSTDVFGGEETGDVETIRWYDKRWYAYVVNGKLITCEEHGFPFLPVGIGTARITSASDYSEMLHGVTWGRTQLEQALNDWATMEQDKRLTFGRPKPIATTVNPAAAQMFSEGLQPKSVDFSGDELLILPPGYDIQNAFKDFQAAQNDPLGQLLLSLWERGGMSPIQQGETPGSDPSGYLVNSLQAAANAKYEGQLDNKARIWEWILDCARMTIRDVIGEPVEIAVPMEEGGRSRVTWLSLGPDDIDDTPCVVTIDPMTDTNRMSITGWLMQGREAKLVPDEIVQTRAYGAEDPMEWNDLILRGMTRDMLRGRAVSDAMEIVDEEMAERERAKAPPLILDQNGRPLSATPGGAGAPGGGPPMNGAMPAQPQPPTVGAQMAGAQQAANPQANWSAGQRPIQQGLAPREAAGVTGG